MTKKIAWLNVGRWITFLTPIGLITGFKWDVITKTTMGFGILTIGGIFFIAAVVLYLTGLYKKPSPKLLMAGAALIAFQELLLVAGMFTLAFGGAMLLDDLIFKPTINKIKNKKEVVTNEDN